MPIIYKAGFTLIELSIVLVIIGLVIGGIMVGRDMIAAAAIRSQISQIEQYNAAVNAFRTKYNCLPGDCANATDFFGIDAVESVCPDPGSGGAVEDMARTAGTCNGDGDGAVTAACTPYDYSTACQEMWRFWQMLSIANLIHEGPFTPLYNYPNHVPGRTVPLAKIGRNNGVGITYFTETTPCCPDHGGPTSYPDFNLAHLWEIGPSDSTAYLSGRGITANEAHIFDIKVDDGIPNKGSVRVPTDTGHYGCTDNTPNYVSGDETYSGGFPYKGCYIIMRAGF